MKSLMEGDVQISLESQLNRIALEFATVDNMVKYLHGVVPSLVQKLQSGIAGFVSTDQTPSASLKDLNASLARRMSGMGMSQFDRVLVSVPEGFEGDFLEYTLQLNELAKDVYRESSNALSNYHSILSSFITNKETKTALSDHSHFIKSIKKNREDMEKSIKRFFRENTKSKARVPDVLARISDLNKLSEEIVKLDRIRSSADLKGVMQEARTVSELLDLIHKNIDSGEYTHISGPATKNISEGAFEIAQMVEFVSVFSFRADQIITTSKSLFEQLDEMID